MALISIKTLLDFLPKGVSTSHKGHWAFQTGDISQVLHIPEQNHVDIRFRTDQDPLCLNCGSTGVATCVANCMTALIRMINAEYIDLQEFFGTCGISTRLWIVKKSMLEFNLNEEDGKYFILIHMQSDKLRFEVEKEVYEQFRTLARIVFCS